MVARAADLVSGTCRLFAGVRRVLLVALSGLLRVPGRLIGAGLLTGLGISGLGISGLGISGLGISGLGISGLHNVGLGVIGPHIGGLGIIGPSIASLVGSGGSRWLLVPTRPAPQHAAQLLSESHRSSPDDDGDCPGRYNALSLLVHRSHPTHG